MPLTTLQKESIALTIGHLLDFSTDDALLLQQLTELQAAILPTLTTTVPNGEFSQLIACLINPQAYFQRLETLNSESITVADVQTYILKLIVKYMHAVAIQTKISPDKLLKLHKIIEAIPDENRITLFTSESASFDTGENPNQLTNNPEQIFTAKLRFPEIENNESVTQYACVDVELNVTTSARIKGRASLMIAEVPFLEDDEAEDAYMDEIKITAQIMAEKMAANCAIRILSASLTLSPIDKLSVFDAGYLLLIQKFYFNLLIDKKLDFAFVAVLNETEVSNLLDPTVIQLLKNDWCDINFASQLYSPQRKVLETYYPLFKNHLYLIETLPELSRARSQFLIQPPIVRLIMQKRLSFEEACILPKFLKSVLINEAYNEYLMRHEIDWDAMSRLTPAHCELLLKPAFAELILLGKVDIDLIGEMSADTLQALNEHCYLTEWLKKGVITDRFFSRMPCLYIYAYSTRLYAVMQGKPFVLNDVTDTIDTIRNELYFTPGDCKLSAPELLQEILWDLLVTLKLNLQKLKKAGDYAVNLESINKFLTPLHAIKPGIHEEPDCQAIFLQLICTADSVREKLIIQEYRQHKSVSSSNSKAAFFGSTELTLSANELHQFCVGLLRFVPFMEAVEAIKKNKLFVSQSA